MRIVHMEQFSRGAQAYLTSDEIIALEERLIEHAALLTGNMGWSLGTPIEESMGLMWHLPHPEAARFTTRGLRPIVVFFVSEKSREIFLVDVIESKAALFRELEKPSTWVKIASIISLMFDLA